MPSSTELREKAERNLAFLNSMNIAAAPEWAAVVAFYAALHLVERLSACESTHNAKHQDRLSFLLKHKKHRAIHADFLALYDASLVARYGTENQFRKAYPGDTVEKELSGKRLSAILAHVEAHFNPPAAQAPPHGAGGPATAGS